MPDPLEICEAISDMLPGPSSVFTAEYFRGPVFPVKVLFNIADLFGFDGIPDDFMAQVFKRYYELGHNSIMWQARFAFVVGLDPSSTRSIVQKFHQARSLPACRAGIADVMSTPPVSGDPFMTLESFLTVRPQQAHGPRRGSIDGSIFPSPLQS